MKASKILLGALAYMLATCAIGADVRELPCSEFKALLGKNAGADLLKRRLIDTFDENQTKSYSNVDVDGDDISDELVGGCSASRSSPDSSTLSLSSFPRARSISSRLAMARGSS